MLAKGQVAILDDFAKLTVTVGASASSATASAAQVDGARGGARAVRRAPCTASRTTLLSWEEASLATLSMFAAQESIRTGEVVNLAAFGLALLGEVSDED